MANEKPERHELYGLAAKVQLVVLDVDGVLTDGGLYYGPEGELMKRFDVKDGHALVMARLVGLRAAILTARKSRIVEVRGQELGLIEVFQGWRDKSAGLEKLCESQQISPDVCAYMGDDVNDLGPLGMVRLAACPSDAAVEVRHRAHFIAQSPGGRGAVRELIELCLKASGRWEQALSHMGAAPLKPS